MYFWKSYICSKKLDVQDGLPALKLWDLIVSVLGNVSRVSDGSGKPESDVHKRH